MSNGSPTAYLLWAILASIFLVFLILHLWSYDRFKCLKWGAGRQPGAFKRIMTYSYLGTVPLLVVFSMAITVIKFREGFILTPSGRIVPRPFSHWKPENRRWLVPLYFLLSVAWSLEHVTHLEELTFWLFLLHQGPGKREWFYSWEYRIWYLGSVATIIGMPLTTLVTRREIDMCLSWIFLIGSAVGTLTTLFFLYVLYHFPTFLLHVKAEGAEPDVVVRLAIFYSLNRIRVIFRFLFTLPLMILALDAIRGLHPIIHDPFAVDFLLMMGGIGCVVSSAITLLIFFPRSITREAGFKVKPNSLQSSKTPATSPPPNHGHHRQPSSPKSAYFRNSLPEIRMSSFQFLETPPPPHPFHPLETHPDPMSRRDSAESELSPGYESDAESLTTASHLPSKQATSTHLELRQTVDTRESAAPSSDDTVWEREQEMAASLRRRDYESPPVDGDRGDVATLRQGTPALQEGGRAQGRTQSSSSQLHPYVMTFTSPIDLMDAHKNRLYDHRSV